MLSVHSPPVGRELLLPVGREHLPQLVRLLLELQMHHILLNHMS
jgi:hypothetical protein